MQEVRHETRVLETEAPVGRGGRLGGEPGFRVQEQRSVGDLFRDLLHETTLLFRQEVALAKTEMQEKTARLARNSAYAGVGGAVLYAGVLALVAAASLAVYHLLAALDVNERLAFWLGPLIVGLIAAGVGYAMLQKGIDTIKKESVVPQKTVDSLQETQQWMKEKIR